MWPTIFDIKLPFWPHELPIRSYGLMLMIAFLGGTWWAARRAERVKANPELIVNCGFVALIAAIIGARAFYVIHYWDESFAGRGLWPVINITAGGLEFYGGFLGAFSTLLVYLLWNRVSLRLYLDIIAPSLAFGLAVTRVGCFLNGCCWGGACPTELPWAVHFPYESPAFVRQWQQRAVALPAELIYVWPQTNVAPSQTAYPFPAKPVAENDAESEQHLKQRAESYGLTLPEFQAEMSRFRSTSLHPAQLYSSIDAAMLALLLSTVFYRRKRQGIVAAMFLICYPIMRIFEEIIRMDNPHDSAGLTISQFVSLPLLALGLGMLIAFWRLPLRSPTAVAYVPPWVEEEKAKARQQQKSPRNRKHAH